MTVNDQEIFWPLNNENVLKRLMKCLIVNTLNIETFKNHYFMFEKVPEIFTR